MYERLMFNVFVNKNFLSLSHHAIQYEIEMKKKNSIKSHTAQHYFCQKEERKRET